MNKKRDDPRKIFVAIIGNLSSGKTEISEAVHKRLGERTWLIPEPVEQWKKCGILKAYYEDQYGLAYPFQQHAFATRMCSYKKIDWNSNDIAISDSHILGDRYVFVKHLEKEGKFKREQVKWYEQYYYEWKELVPECDPDIIMYLKTSPKCCHARMKQRGRDEEKDVPLSYLEGIHACLEGLVKMDEIRSRVMTIDGNQDFEIVVDLVEKEIRHFRRNSDS